MKNDDACDNGGHIWHGAACIERRVIAVRNVFKDKPVAGRVWPRR